MCRHLAYLGPALSLRELLVDPPGGLYTQSWAPRRQRYGTVNADGFGIGWYPGGGEPPARYRRAVPVWADGNLPDLARTVRSGAVLAAVRSATPGTTQDESAAAPYRGGPWLFSHNGAVPDWTRALAGLARDLTADDLLAVEARCDSALLWALVHQRLRAGQPAGRALADVAVRTARACPEARVNLLLTDGRSVTATRCGDTLWYRTAPGAVLVASEPSGEESSGEGGGWREVPEHSLLRATAETVEVVPLPAAPAPRPSPSPTASGLSGPSERMPTA